ncbi:MAG: penicillin-binding protein 2, partial [Candidatus Andersenbacteria bacterium RIFCSPHIGHO2_02_FULL_45_11]
MNIDLSELIEQQGSRTGQGQRRLNILSIVLCVTMTAIVGRGAYLQVLQGSSFRARAEHNRLESTLVPAPRGIIYDMHHLALVENISSTDLVITPSELPLREHEDGILDRLAGILTDTPPEEIQAAITKARTTRQNTLLSKAISHDTVLEIEKAERELPGVHLASSLVRKYPYAESLAHVLGYTSPVTAEELDEHTTLVVTDTTGKQGIEKTYDTSLRGQHGFTSTEVNASGNQKTDLGTKAAVPGEDLTLTIHADLQKFIYGLFSEANEKRNKIRKDPIKGVAIVLDVNSGAVRSLISYPSYDSNTFSQPSLRSQTAKIFQEVGNPLFNRATDGMYPSGSTIKPFLAAAALQEGVITPQTTVRSTGGIKVGPWSFGDWKTGGHGVTDVRKALAESVNTFFYMIAGGLDGTAGLGVDKATQYLRTFGWGANTGIDLPSEASGFLPSPQWKLKATGQPWYIGDTYHLGIGQGDVLATPLQVASATGAIAQGEYLYQPHLIEGSITKRKISIRPEYVRVVQEGMRLAVNDGSARSLATLSMPIAGKTGTAQIGGTEKTHAWFTSFGPYEKPEYVVT